MGQFAEEPAAPRGRGSAENPANRFEKLHLDVDPDLVDELEPAPDTVFLRDDSRSILARNESPDVGFEWSVNPYRGCEHGCAYCYARPTHEYLGFSAGLDFESRILVKERAPELLREALDKKSWNPAPIAMCGVTDAYQPVERRLEITRRCLEVLAAYGNPVTIVTKNALVARDADLLGALAGQRAASVMISVTTLDAELSGALEPRASRPDRRLEAVRRLSEAGIPTGVLVGPVIPGLTDHELPAILEAGAAHGAVAASFIVLRLPLGVADLFEDWLDRHAPNTKDSVMRRVRELRGGARNDSQFGSRMRGTGAYAERIRGLFLLGLGRSGLADRLPELSTAAFRRPHETPPLF